MKNQPIFNAFPATGYWEIDGKPVSSQDARDIGWMAGGAKWITIATENGERRNEMDRAHVVTNLGDAFDEAVGSLDDPHKVILLRLLGVTQDRGVFIFPDNVSYWMQGALDFIDRQLTPDHCEQQFQEEYDRNG